ncbi:reprolysin-like metallopeptidase [Pseudomonas sp. WOUb67]|uniref:reprolysin-like metallopeptidase n=1 Tax=Pseudomonas sp. WOUb67 TaxID=3161136 RepID=UPI003CEB9560
MKKHFFASCLMAASWGVIAACAYSFTPAMAATPQPLRLLEPDRSSDVQALERTPGTYPYLTKLIKDPASEHVQIVNVQASLVSAETKTLRVQLSNDKAVDFKLRRADPPAPGMEGWVGDVLSESDQKPRSNSEIDFDPLTWISLVRKDDHLVGSLYVEGQHYRLEYVGAGKHVLIKENASKLPPEALFTPELGTSALGKAPQSAHSTIRVLFTSTNEVRTERPTYREQLVLAMQSANQYMLNSRVPVTFEIADFYDVDYCACGKTGVEQFSDFKLPGRELNTQVMQKRAQVYADLMTLYTSWPGTGGEAYGRAYSIVGSYNTLGHEYGHNFGAWHGWNGNESAGYNHGYKHENPRFHTIMITTGGAIPYFSNPRLTYQGVSIGTVKHHDVARTLDENRGVIEDLSPPIKSAAAILYSQENFQGDSCRLFNIQGTAVSISSECRNQPVRSFRVTGDMVAQKFCLYDQSGARHVCYAGGANSPTSFEVTNVDQPGAPPTFVRTQKGNDLSGAAVDLLYGNNAILLFAGANFTKPLCSFPLYPGEYVVADTPGCPEDAGGKARSAKIFQQLGPDGQLTGRQWCFFNGDRSRTLCLKGGYWGKFGVANFDSAQGIPPEIVRTQSGGYMNGSVHRVKVDIVSVP